MVYWSFCYHKFNQDGTLFTCHDTFYRTKRGTLIHEHESFGKELTSA